MAASRRAASRNVDAKTRADPQFADFRVEDSPFYLIARTNGRYVLDMERQLKRIGMDLPRWRTLMIVHEHEVLSISEIADYAVMRLSTMTRVAQKLEKEGLVHLSVRESDARKTDVTLSPEGEEAVKRVRRVASRIYQQAFHDFTAREIQQLNETLRRVFDNLTPQA